ncbi:MAG: diguanylate cyclase [Pseudomonadota bacterium]
MSGTRALGYLVLKDAGDISEADRPHHDVRRGRLAGFQVPFTRYRREDGLPSGQVFGLAQDIHQVFWFATPGGLARFDGARFQTFTAKNGLSSHGLRCVTADCDGTVWVGSDTGIDHVDHNGALLASSADEQWQYGPVDCIFVFDNELWVGSAGGLLVRRSSQWVRVADESIRTMASVQRRDSDDHVLWLATTDGRLLVQRGEEFRAPASDDARSLGKITCLCAIGPDRLIAGGRGGLAELDSKGRATARLAHVRAGEGVSAVCRAGGDLWAGIGRTFCRLRRHDDLWEISSVVTSRNAINEIVVDTIGGIWGATDGNGIVKVSPLHEMIRPLSLARNTAVFSIRQGMDGQLLVGGDQFSSVLHPGGAADQQTLEALDHYQAWDLLQMQDGRLFAATEKGLLQLAADGQSGHFAFAGEPVVSRACRALVEHDGTLWVGGRQGLVTIDRDGRVARAATLNEETMGYVYTLVADASGTLWCGTIGNGLWRSRDGRFERVLAEHLTEQGSTYCIAVRADNVLAIAQDDRIVLRHADDDFELLARSEDPIAGWSLGWGKDPRRLWAGSASGLHAYDIVDKCRAHHITAVLGLSQWEFTTSRSLHVTDGGLVYCGLNSGLVVVDPQYLDDDMPAPVARAARIDWSNAEPVCAGDGAFELDSDRWSLRVALCCPWFLDEQDIRFRYRMVGFEEDWSELSDVPEARYSSLPLGEYRLEVQAFSRLLGFGPASRVLTMRVVDRRFGRGSLLAPLRAARRLVDAYSGLRRNRALLVSDDQLEEEIGNRTAELVRARDKLQQLNASLTEQVTTDALTGISSRRHFDVTLAEVLRESLMRRQPLSMLFIDIDHFKAFNDRYGHTRGDECLGFVARRIEANLYRSADTVSRYGGEEFAVVSPQTDESGAMALAERLRASVQQLNIRNEGAPGPGVVTVSVGVTTLPGHHRFRPETITGQKIISIADRALYDAKASGRNQCMYHAFDAAVDSSMGPSTGSKNRA